MARAERGMGRGLAALLPSASRHLDSLRELAVESVRPNPRQPRRDFDAEALVALSESIRARGVLQPIVVRPVAGQGFELVAGERRLRAAGMAGLERVPAIVRQAEESEQLELAMIENMAREDLNPVEEARACATLVEDLGLTKEELGRRVGRSRVAVSNLIRLLDLPDDVLSLLESGQLSEGHGRALLLRRDQADRRRLAREAVAGRWSVREAERRAKAAEAGAEPAPPDPVVLHPDLADTLGAAEDALSAALGRTVRVRQRGERCRVEFDLESPLEGVELAERLLRRNAA
ncbi:MAG: ParB/RepB/Spo0J family partition protein [Thermoleophilaceae bacterium]